MARQYYSMRKNPVKKLDLDNLKRMFLAVFHDFMAREYFSEQFGYCCVDQGDVPGKAGHDLKNYILRNLRKENLWPIDDNYGAYQEDDLFDVIEFLFDHISKPIDGTYHSYNNCGTHYTTFNKPIGQKEFRVEMNELLKDYQDGYELSETGEMLSMGVSGAENLLKAKLPTYDVENVDKKVNEAIVRFRRYRSSITDRKHAVRDLADVLEFLRPEIKRVINKKDEGDLFNIVNNFSIRHHEKNQKKEYDQAIWLSWMLYFYLATIHTVLHLIKSLKFKQ